ncbi:MFS transporter [Bryobacterales bacterium F-183]|nr:MFS transporter [Bryobacterales bacterium F-183]
MYYGWVNLALAALAMVATLPGRTQGLGLVTEPLIAELGISRVDFATINLWATLIGALFTFPFGRWVDRLGPRAVTAALLALLGSTVIWMSGTQGFWPLAAAVTLTRGFGQSALSAASLALAGKWFAKRLNLAMGIFALLVAMGFIGAFPGVGAAVTSYGWRRAWLGVGVALLAIAPVAALLIRNRPPAASEGDVEELGRSPEDMTLEEALRTPAFWVFGLSSALFGLVYSGIALFNESILAQRGFDAGVYHRTLVISTMLGLLANFAGGWAAQKWDIRKLTGIGMGVLALSLVLLPAVTSLTHVDVYAGLMGIAGGIVTVVFFSVWGQAFGRSHLGRIQGFAQMLTVLASAVGPLLLARTLEATGSYDSIFHLLAVLVALLGVASWMAPMPQRAARGLAGTGFDASPARL